MVKKFLLYRLREKFKENVEAFKMTIPSLLCPLSKAAFTQNHRINIRGWKGPPEDIESNPLPKQDPPGWLRVGRN